jgi:large subunit ribosomal protein L18
MLKKTLALKKRHGSIRKRLSGDSERPRLYVRRSLNHIYVQIINDLEHKTLFSYSTLNKGFEKPAKGKIAAAEKLGEVAGKLMVDKGIKKVAFDRGGYKYHGRVKALADSLRKAGLDF